MGQCPEENAHVGGWERCQLGAPERSDQIFHWRRMESVCLEMALVAFILEAPFLPLEGRAQCLHVSADLSSKHQGQSSLFQLWALGSSSLILEESRGLWASLLVELKTIACTVRRWEGSQECNLSPKPEWD